MDEDTLDSALLLVTELVTNVVVHAGTPATVDVRRERAGPGVLDGGLRGLDHASVTDEVALTVRVRDLHPVRIGAARRGGDHGGGGPLGGFGESGLGGLREDGRGLALVDALASAWGTEHGAGGKSVWFRLVGTPGGRPAGTPPDAAGAPGAAGTPPAPREGDDDAAGSGLDGMLGMSGFFDETFFDEGLTVPTQPTSLPGAPPAPSDFPEPRAAATGSRPAVSFSRPSPGPFPRAPRIVSRSTARALTAEGEVAELLAQLVDTQPVTGGLVRRPSPDDPDPETVAVLGTTGSVADALAFPLDETQDLLGEVLLWRDPGQPGTIDTERVGLVARWMALALGGGDMRQAEERRMGMLTFLAEASDLLAGSLSLEHTLPLLAHLPVPRLGRWCAVYLRRDDGIPTLAAVAHADEVAESDLAKSAGDADGALMAAVRSTGTSPVRHVLLPDGQALVAVLRARRRVVGMLAVGRDLDTSFAADDVDLLADLARRAAFAVDNARLYSRQVELADGLQAGLRPPVLPEIPGLDLGAAYGAARSAGLDVGGDFFDLMQGPDGWTIAIGDVCGKGAEAATVTGVARAILRLLTGQATPVDRILVDLNRTLRDTAATYPHGQPRFCTLATARLGDSAAGRGRRLTLHLAGHPQPVVLRADGSAAYVGVPGTLLGVLDDDEVAFPSLDVDLRPGDALVLYTDGVVEARSGRELLGEQRLLEAVAGCAGMSAQGIADRVRGAADRFAGGNLRDDIAIVVVRVPTPAAEPALAALG